MASSGLSGGTEIETDEELRARLKKRMQAGQGCGSVSDFENLVLSYAGVTKVFVCEAEKGCCSVGIRFLMESTYPNNYGIPQQNDIDNVQNFINQPENRPLGARVCIGDLVACPIDIEISGLQPNCTDAKIAIQTALEANLPSIKASGCSQTLCVSEIYKIISNVEGVECFSISNPTSDQLLPLNCLPVLGVLNYAV